jgi:capsular polysaccharide biosynthesis protein
VELRAYWTIIWRRIWLIALVVVVVALFAGYKYYQLRKTPGALTTYSSSITIQIGLQAQGGTSNAGDVTTTEALAAEFATGPILTSHEFDQDVLNQIDQDGASADFRNVNPVAIGQALSASATYSLVSINATWITPVGAKAIANAVGEVSEAKIGSYLGSLVQPAVAAQVISSATTAGAVPGPSSSKVTLYILLVLLALVIGIALAFLLDYLDDRIRDKDEVAHLLGVPIYAEVPSAPVPGRSRLAKSANRPNSLP